MPLPPEKPITIQYEAHGVIATLDGSVCGFGKHVCDAIADLMYKLGIWIKGY